MTGRGREVVSEHTGIGHGMPPSPVETRNFANVWFCMVKDVMNRFIALVESDEPYFFGQPFATIVVLVLTTFALFLGIVYSVFLGNTLRFPDETIYVKLANNLLSNNFYSIDSVTPSATRPPGYSFFLYSVFLLGYDIAHVRMVQFGLFALSILLLHKILILWSYRLASVIAGFLVLCYPVLFFTAGTLYPQTLTSLLFLLVCYLGMSHQMSLSKSLVAGVAFGSLVLTTPIFVAVLPILLVGPCMLAIRKKLLATILFLLSATVVITPWMVRNYVTFDRFVPFAANSGLMLLLGNSENASANLGPTTNISQYRTVTIAEHLSEIEEDMLYRSEALNWILKNKGEAAALYVSKFVNHFNFRNELATREESTWWRDVVMFVTYYFLLCLATLRVARGGSLKTRPFEMFAVVSYLVMAGAYAIFFTRIRYRLPLDWMLIAMAAIYAASLLEGIKGMAVHVKRDGYESVCDSTNRR